MAECLQCHDRCAPVNSAFCSVCETKLSQELRNQPNPLPREKLPEAQEIIDAANAMCELLTPGSAGCFTHKAYMQLLRLSRALTAYRDMSANGLTPPPPASDVTRVAHYCFNCGGNLLDEPRAIWNGMVACKSCARHELSLHPEGFARTASVPPATNELTRLRRIVRYVGNALHSYNSITDREPDADLEVARFTLDSIEDILAQDAPEQPASEAERGKSIEWLTVIPALGLDPNASHSVDDVLRLIEQLQQLAAIGRETVRTTRLWLAMHEPGKSESQLKLENDEWLKAALETEQMAAAYNEQQKEPADG